MQKRTWKVDARAWCDCGWTAMNYKNAQALGALHAMRTGHTVMGEVGLAFEYKGGA